MLKGSPGEASQIVVASGHGWTVADVLCTSGPKDRPFEEQHARVSIAIVAAGTFQYRSSSGRAVMTPGSILLGTAGGAFECGHEHAAGDRCLAFQYDESYFETLAGGLLPTHAKASFGTNRIPPVRNTSRLIAQALAGLTGGANVSWEEISTAVAGQAVLLSARASDGRGEPLSAEARVTKAVRRIDHEPDGELSLGALASDAGLSPFHFLRVFERITGVTPHQYLLRARLRRAAMCLRSERAKVLDVALDSGFSDLSNFSRSFRAEFGMGPRDYRRQGRS